MLIIQSLENLCNFIVNPVTDFFLLYKKPTNLVLVIFPTQACFFLPYVIIKYFRATPWWLLVIQHIWDCYWLGSSTWWIPRRSVRGYKAFLCLSPCREEEILLGRRRHWKLWKWYGSLWSPDSWLDWSVVPLLIRNLYYYIFFGYFGL